MLVVDNKVRLGKDKTEYQIKALNYFNIDLKCVVVFVVCFLYSPLSRYVIVYEWVTRRVTDLQDNDLRDPHLLRQCVLTVLQQCTHLSA